MLFQISAQVDFGVILWTTAFLCLMIGKKKTCVNLPPMSPRPMYAIHNKSSLYQKKTRFEKLQFNHKLLIATLRVLPTDVYLH